MSGSGEGFGDFDDDCIKVATCAVGASNLFILCSVENISSAQDISRYENVSSFQ